MGHGRPTEQASDRVLGARHVVSRVRQKPAGVRVGAACLVLLLVAVARGQVGTTLQMPEFGVAIDADGVVSRRAVEDPGGRLAAQRAAAARAALPADVIRPARLRKISLVGLDAALRRRGAAPMPSSGTSPG
jgi:hypothetical protein